MLSWVRLGSFIFLQPSSCSSHRCFPRLFHHEASSLRLHSTWAHAGFKAITPLLLRCVSELRIPFRSSSSLLILLIHLFVPLPYIHLSVPLFITSVLLLHLLFTSIYLPHLSVSIPPSVALSPLLSPPLLPPSIMAPAPCRFSGFSCLLLVLLLPAVRSSFPRSGGGSSAECGPGKADCPGKTTLTCLHLDCHRWGLGMGVGAVVVEGQDALLSVPVADLRSACRSVEVGGQRSHSSLLCFLSHY